MKDTSHIASKIQASATLQVDALYKQMRAQGVDCIGFGAGEPDFDTSDSIKTAAFDAIKANKTKYTPSGGIPELRSAIAERLRKDCNINYAPNQIVVASGAKHSIFATLQVLLNPGDEVILPAPYWVTYNESIKMAGGIPIVVSAPEENDFKITSGQLENAITDKTKLLILCNPSNPTGMLYNADELRALTNVCARHDLYIISDEVYYRFVYDEKTFTSAASFGNIYERTIIINGVSKTYSMTGWRIGYAASNTNIAKIMENYISHSTSAPSTISQYAAIEALSGPQDDVIKMRNTFMERRDYVVSRINAMEGVSCRKPDGAFYVMMHIDELIGRSLGGKVIRNSDDFALAFLESGLVATVSCTDFGVDNFIRLTYATSMEAIKEGLDRLEKFIVLN